MFRPLARRIAVMAFPSLIASFLHASVQQHDPGLSDVTDPTFHVEIAQLGLYPEIIGEDSVVPLDALPLRSCSADHVEFFGDGIRVRIEAQVFDHPTWVKRSRGMFKLEGSPILGWSRATPHSRMSRVEVVIDGTVVELPVEAFTDLFDPLLGSRSVDGLSLFATAARSLDGWRTYVHAQVGEGIEARIITWVIEDGHYQLRVIDKAE